MSSMVQPSCLFAALCLDFSVDLEAISFLKTVVLEIGVQTAVCKRLLTENHKCTSITNNECGLLIQLGFHLVITQVESYGIKGTYTQ